MLRPTYLARAALALAALAALIAVASAAHAQSSTHTACDASAAATVDAAHACGGAVESVTRTRLADRATVARLLAAVERGDRAAAAAALDDHVLWVGPAGRVFGRAAVAAHLAALGATAETLALDPDGRVTVTSRHPDGHAVRSTWRLVHGLVVGIDQADHTPAGTLPDGRIALEG